MAADTEEPELITEDATRLVVPSFGAKKPLVDAEPEKAADGGAAACHDKRIAGRDTVGTRRDPPHGDVGCPKTPPPSLVG